MDHNTEIIVITDRSGSMNYIRNDAIGGYATFLAEQKTQPGNARVTSVIFDDKYEVQYQAVPISVAQGLALDPRGSTAMYDAIGRTLEEQGKRITEEKWAHLVIVVIITDGEENASREYSAVRIKEMITKCEAHDWKFVFLAANQDAFSAGENLGISKSTTMGYAATGEGTRAVYGSAAAMTSTLRSVSRASTTPDTV